MPPFVAAPTKAEEAAAHPLNEVLMYLPHVGAPEDETERRQLRATYHGAQKEVDDQLSHLFDYLDATGLIDSTLVVLTSDHGEMGGDHWLIEKLGYWDESFHVPLIIRDPDPAGAAGLAGARAEMGSPSPSPSRACSSKGPRSSSSWSAWGPVNTGWVWPQEPQRPQPCWWRRSES